MAFNYSPKVITDGLVLYLDAANTRSYPGTGTAWNDLSRSGNNGTLTNGPTFNSGNGGSIVFDGVDDYVNLSPASGFASFSVMVWFYPTVVQNYNNVLDMNYNSLLNSNTGNYGPRLEMDNAGSLIWVYSASSNNNNFYSQRVLNSGLQSNIWTCATITYNGSTNNSITYYNGNDTGISRINGGSGGGGFIGTFNTPRIGLGFGSFNLPRYFQGRISNVQIYNRALSSTEILQNYNATKTRFGL
jgi:hypothetical protein